MDCRPVRVIAVLGLLLAMTCGASAQTKPLAVVRGAGEFVEQSATPELLQRLRQGGFVLYMRHGTTDNSRADRVPQVDLNDCGTQRVLSDPGRDLMRQVGKALRSARIPFNEVLVSPMCRTRESAQLAVGNGFKISDALMYSSNLTSEEKQPRLAELRRLLSAPVDKGGNRLLVAHAPNLDDLIGYFVRPEGTVVVFEQASENGFRYLASIHPQDWSKLQGR